MRNVQRLKKPRVLEANEAKWRQDLLDELAKGNRADKKRLKGLYGKYAHDEVKARLAKMYKNYCCYCECKITVVTRPHIEHRKPKDRKQFPELTFDWDNLHLVCPNCNGSKGSQWDSKHPILDAVQDVPISDHLVYRKYYRYPTSARGRTTRDHANLDGTHLVDARVTVFWEAYRLIEEHNKNPQAPGAGVVRAELHDLTDGQFGSFIDYLIDLLMKES